MLQVIFGTLPTAIQHTQVSLKYLICSAHETEHEDGLLLPGMLVDDPLP